MAATRFRMRPILNTLSRKGMAAALVLSLIATTATAGAGDNQGEKSIQWLDFEKALAAAQKQDKVLLVDFYTDWCGWCKVMDKKTYAHPEIVAYASKNLVLSKVNAESSQVIRYKDREFTLRQLAAAFGVRGYPATVFIDANGDLITLVSGFIPAERFLPILEFLSEGHYKTMKFDAFLAKRKDKS